MPKNKSSSKPKEDPKTPSKPSDKGKGGKPTNDPPPQKGKGAGGKQGAAETGKGGTEGQPVVNVKRELFGSWSKKAGGHQYRIVISKEDKKTRLIRKVTWCDTQAVFPSDQEAKHHAATYVLHRVCSHTSYHLLLPPSQRDYWATLEERRKALSPSIAQYQYAPDPFVAEEMRERAEKERVAAQAAAREEKAKKLEKLRSPWESYPEVHMSAENRKCVEELVKTELAEDAGGKGLQDDLSADEKQRIVRSLVRTGFRPVHVEEALQYCHDETSTLNWLCVHVPEDDLPPNFLPSMTPEIIAQQHTPASLAREYATKRLAASGFSRKVCEAALTECGDNEVAALVSMTKRLALDSEEVPEPEAEVPLDDADLASIRQEEIEALEAIFGSSFQSTITPTATTLSVILTLPDVKSTTTLDVTYETASRYPNDLPAVVLRNDKLPAYIRLSAMKQVNKEATQFLGSPMVFALVSWAEEHVPAIVNAPPPLVDIERGVAASVVEGSGADSQRLAHNAVKNGRQSARASGAKKKRERKVENDMARLAEKSHQILQTEERKRGTPEYQKMQDYRKKLPSYLYRDEILQALEQNQVLIVCGETGCGKSTQLGQFILENMISSNQGATCNIICTQPRRISAMALAERVSAERAERVGQSVGYAIRGETVRGPDTMLLFCTTGILLRMVQNDTELENVSHIIVDEVHERGIDSDFLLVIVRELLRRRRDLRLVLMSATVNSETFSNYFNGAPVFEIPGFTHPVRDVYLETILRSVRYVPDLAGRGGGGKKKKGAEEADPDEEVRRMYEGGGLDDRTVDALVGMEKGEGKVDYGLIAAVVRHICMENVNDDGAILMFMPGVMEIKRCIETIRPEAGSQCGRLDIMPLHANLSSKEQSAVFKKMPKGVRKVVVATNIAETSITIDDVVFVVDVGRVKEMRFNGSMMCLTEIWASRASCKQRRGRAGRVRPGVCYKLFTKRLEEKRMPASQEPEIVRTPLEQLCLQVKAMGHDDVRQFLGNAIDPPSMANIDLALSTLETLNAIDRDSGALTALGRHMATIPADLRIAKILLFGAIFKCLGPVLTIAACMSAKSPFVAPMDKRDEAKSAREKFSSDRSDWLTDCRAYDNWKIVGKKGRREEREWCDENFLSTQTLIAISDLRKQYLDILIELGYVPRAYHHHKQQSAAAVTAAAELDLNSSHPQIVKATLVAGLYPNVARIQMPERQYDQTAHGSVVVDSKASEIRFFTKEDGRVFIHPASTIFSTSRFDTDALLIYHQKISTSKIFLRDATSVSVWPVLMFGGKLKVDHGGRALMIDEGRVKVKAFPRIAVLVEGIRRLLDKALDAKIEQPDLDVTGTPVVQTMVKLLLSDGM
ncbi:hypothetical protein HK104_000837 [Borealophlyctis nickersoniae]|nr:hypothetical protein HK104_000837 [Borealophlyctis nickersoniae]